MASWESVSEGERVRSLISAEPGASRRAAKTSPNRPTTSGAPSLNRPVIQGWETTTVAPFPLTTRKPAQRHSAPQGQHESSPGSSPCRRQGLESGEKPHESEKQSTRPEGARQRIIRNTYTYGGEGRICAVKSLSTGLITGYLYDAEGVRVIKGSLGTAVCPNSAASFAAVTAQYLLGPGGEQVTGLSGAGSWVHTNVWAAGKLDATYDTNGLHFHFSDPLGTRRVQVAGGGASPGCIENSFQSLPYGNGLTAYPGCESGDDATEHHFTGKERDSESGNDYFGARYYASTMGRFLSPDKPVDQHPEDPQSWNLYSYVRNNPLISIDQDGNYDCGQMTADQCTQFGNNLTAAQNQLATAHQNGTITDAQFKQGSDALGAYGTLNDHNGVTVNVGATGGYPGTTYVSNDGTVSAANPTGQNIQVTFNPRVFGGNSDALNGVIGHEGSHVGDGEAWAKAGFTDAARPTNFDTEFKAYGVTTIFGAAQGARSLLGTKPGDTTPHLIWLKNFSDDVNNAVRTNMDQSSLSELGGKGV